MAINFESARQKDEMRGMLREAREQALDKAKKEHDDWQAKKEAARQRGDDKWMLPSVDARLSSSKSKERKSKKSKKEKKEKKEKKAKKSKKSHKRKSSSEDSDSSEDEWVEKNAPTASSEPPKPLERESWMCMPSVLPTFSKKDVAKPDRVTEEQKTKMSMNQLGQTSRELNPYWKNGGTGLPPERSEGETPEPKRRRSRSRSRSHSPQRGNRERKRSRSRSKERSSSRSVRDPQSSKSTSRFLKPSEHHSDEETDARYYQSRNRSSGSRTGRKPSPVVKSEPDHSHKSLPSPPPEASESEEDEEEPALTEQEMNAIGAKIVKAEIMGNTQLAAELKMKLERARNKVSKPKVGKDVTKREPEDRTVILTKTDNRGMVRPVAGTSQQSREGKGKRVKSDTHKGGQRVRYFPDDDKYSLTQMFEREKSTTVEDDNLNFARLASKAKRGDTLNADYDLDDMLENRASRASDSKAAEAERQAAIRQHQSQQKVLDNCQYCPDSSAMQKHLIVALGAKVYLCVPGHESLTEGHCLLIPRSHVTCATQLDEDVWEELQTFRKALTRMFEEREEDVVYFESAMHLRRFPHMVWHCVPLPRELGDTAPIYFKKALLECETEWAMNKKVVDLSQKDVRRAVPKGLPYFSVDFGNQGGFGHVIEDEQMFPTNFAQEILGGMLDLEPRLWRKPRRQSFEEQRRKVIQFAEMWKPFDFTTSLQE